MERCYRRPVFLALFSVLLACFSLPARENPALQKSGAAAKPNAGFTSYTLLNIGNYSYWLANDGISAHHPVTWDAGGIYPRGTARVIYQDGLTWAGFVQDPNPAKPRLRAGGQRYLSGTVPGRIISPGVAQDPNDPAARIYRIRRDYQTVSDEELRRDAAEQFYNGDISKVTQVDIDGIRAQYGADWNEWPVEWGAPFYDLNGNGLYEPVQGETPGLANADQAAWFVCNDLDEDHTYWSFGSPPIGLELQVTVWGYNLPNSSLGQAVFKRYRLLNKSGFAIDSMFIGQWSDPDIGVYTDDFAGCDTLLDLGYAYSAYPVDSDFDQFGLPPSAAGYILLRGASGPSSNFLRNFDFSSISSSMNLSMTSFIYLAYSTFYPEPGEYELTLWFFNYLRGYRGSSNIANPPPYIVGAGPTAGQPTKFPLAGDPVLDTGDVDGKGNNPPPTDRRFLMSSGPFTMQPGDTQEVIVAFVGGNRLNGDNLTSVAELKTNAGLIKQSFENGLLIPRPFPPQIDAPDDQHTALALQIDLGDFPEATGALVYFSPETGNEADFTVPLFDDGAHNDSLPGDRTWGGSITVPNRQYPFNGDLAIYTPGGQIDFPRLYSYLALRRRPVLQNWRVRWENGKQDGRINLGERVHLRFDVLNTDGAKNIDRLEIRLTNRSVPQRFTYVSSHTFPAGQLSSREEQYIVADAPREGDSLNITLAINYDYHTFSESPGFPVSKWYPDTLQGQQLPVSGPPIISDNIIPLIADPTLLTGHTYRITFAESSDSALGWQLTDLNANVVKWSHGQISNAENYPHPVIDGIQFRVTEQTALPPFLYFIVTANAAGPLDPPDMGVLAFRNDGFPFFNGSDRPDRSRQQTNGTGWVIHTGNIKTGNQPDYSYQNFLQRVLRNDNVDRLIPYDYEIRFSEAPDNYANWAYTDQETRPVPFELWNIGFNTPEDPADDFRMIPWILPSEAAGDSSLDPNLFQLDPNDHPISGGSEDPYTPRFYWREPFDKTPGRAGYDAFVASGGSYADSSAEVMADMALVSWNGGLVSHPNFPANLTASLPEPGTVFRIVSAKPLTIADTFYVQAPAARPDSIPPTTPLLLQNYPNPFNDRTIIRFYVPDRMEVRLEIFNILGQRVKTLLEERKEEGYHQVGWDGRSDGGERVSTGIYFYRLQGEGRATARKLVLVR